MDLDILVEHEYCRQRYINLAKLRQAFHALREGNHFSRLKVKGIGAPGLSQQYKTQHVSPHKVLYEQGGR